MTRRLTRRTSVWPFGFLVVEEVDEMREIWMGLVKGTSICRYQDCTRETESRE